VLLDLQVRRFFCGNGRYGKTTFAEQYAAHSSVPLARPDGQVSQQHGIGPRVDLTQDVAEHGSVRRRQ
jgi:adenosyl cobinamide kinase/adenosyl cobinamide phosphate guanylyltransferase